MNLTGDSFALFLLCSHLGLDEELDEKPLSARAWNQLESKLAANAVSLADWLEEHAQAKDPVAVQGRLF